MKYFYARTYLRALLILAALVVILGIAFASVQLVWIVSDLHNYQISKNAPLTVDTKDLIDELKYTSVVVDSFILQLQHHESGGAMQALADDFDAGINKRDIGVGVATRLRREQIDGFESCLQVARNDSTTFKTELLKEFLATLNDIETSTLAVLNAPKGGLTDSGKSGVRERHPQSQSDETKQQLFSPQALVEMQSEDLNAAVSFLRKGPQPDIVSYISPQVGMRTAADELQALLQFIQLDLQRLPEERQSHLTDGEQVVPAVAGTSTKEAVLRRFLNELSLCEQLAKVNVGRGWIVDGQIEQAQNRITSFRTEREATLVSLRTHILNCAMLAGIAALLTAIVALILLMIRDFLSALIDTAVNTGVTANTLEKIRQGDTAPGE